MLRPTPVTVTAYNTVPNDAAPRSPSTRVANGSTTIVNRKMVFARINPGVSPATSRRQSRASRSIIVPSSRGTHDNGLMGGP
jgi:hypothetical protein